MERIWLALYLLLAFLAIFQAALMALQTWENRRFARNRIRELDCYRPHGRAIVVAPCKGVDLELEDNLRALLVQDYDDGYEVTFIVESDDDPACSVIRRIMNESHKVNTRLVIAGRTQSSCQKVHNLQAATADIPSDVEYLVFVDSDARPRREWLRSMVSHLNRPGVGAATGYRWFIPSRPSLANYILYSINCGVALWLGHGGRHLLWGGSWAMRRDIFQWLRVRDAWEGRPCDDLSLSALLLRRRLRIVFQPPCMVASPVDHGLGDMFRFVRRQYQLARCDIPKYWLTAIACGAIPLATWFSSAAMLAWGLLGGAVSPCITTVVAAMLYELYVLRSWIRQDLTRTYFPSLHRQLRGPRWFDIWAAPLTGAFNYMALLGSTIGHEIHWRGIHYRWGKGGRIISIRHEACPTEESACERKAA